MSSLPAVLWLTRRYPFPPAQGGDVIYTRHLLATTAAAGARISVLVADETESGPRDFDNGAVVEWVGGGRRQRSSVWSLFSSLPNLASRFSTSSFRQAIRRVVVENDRWDAIVSDSLSMAPFAQLARDACRKRGQPTNIVYVSHNHEATTLQTLANEIQGPAKLVYAHDAAKATRLEEVLVSDAVLVTTNTEEDAQQFRRSHPDKRCLVLRPGYVGPRLASRQIASTERSVILLGSFQWIAKQKNLESFLEASAVAFRERNIALRVVGFMDGGFQAAMAEKFPHATIVGPVDDPTDELARARMGAIPEEAGGGFKHKTLNYVFNRVPVVGLAAALSGVPLVDGDSCLIAADIPALIEIIVSNIDNVPLLQQISEKAYASCEAEFDWSERGQHLAAALAELREARVAR